MAKPKDKGLDLAIVFGGPKKGAPKEDPAAAEPSNEVDDVPEQDEAIPPDFEAAAAEAFPDLAEDPERMAAFHRACKAAGGM